MPKIAIVASAVSFDKASTQLLLTEVGLFLLFVSNFFSKPRHSVTEVEQK